MEKFEEKLEKVLESETVGSRLQIPLPLLDEIKGYQILVKKTGGKKMSRENIIIRMMLHGKEGLEKEKKEMLKKLVEELS
ncbi:MAG: hypothetical protein Unbinned5350contig1001_20 [Prokaryotic dsDNA virus sp.]|nr:MAG: hypothetical protein Unbinned5350contig1001_20 [Prokaryotic dsDNA virus sp.]|tara:strand:- start:24344 stop:24583 length:240 start_codon:yes stop_codon:yes gene_type:complete